MATAKMLSRNSAPFPKCPSSSCLHVIRKRRNCCTGCGCRRLYRKALRHRRTARPHPRGAAPCRDHTAGSRPAKFWRPRSRSLQENGNAGHPSHPPHPQGLRPACSACRQCRPRRDQRHGLAAPLKPVSITGCCPPSQPNGISRTEKLRVRVLLQDLPNVRRSRAWF